MALIKGYKVFSAILFFGLLGIFIGIVIAIFRLALWAMNLGYGETGIFVSFFGFWVTLILSPIIYGIVFLLGGLIFTLLVNLSLKIVKGLEINLDTANTNAVPKPSKK